MKGLWVYPTFTYQPFEHAMLSDHGETSTASPFLQSRCCLPLFQTRRLSRFLGFRGSIASTFRPTACSTSHLRLTHLVTSTRPRFRSKVAGQHFFGVDLHYLLLRASWRTKNIPARNVSEYTILARSCLLFLRIPKK
jgi:hypothetical protein